MVGSDDGEFDDDSATAPPCRVGWVDAYSYSEPHVCYGRTEGHDGEHVCFCHARPGAQFVAGSVDTIPATRPAGYLMGPP